MTAITIQYYLPLFSSTGHYPTARQKIQTAVKRSYGFMHFGGFDLIKRVKHYASANVISVYDPEVAGSDFDFPVRTVVPVTMAEFDKLVEAYPTEDLRQGSHSRSTCISAYERMILDSYPGMDTHTNNKGVLCCRLWVVDIELIENRLDRLFFLNEDDAKVAVQTMRSVM